MKPAYHMYSNSEIASVLRVFSTIHIFVSYAYMLNANEMNTNWVHYSCLCEERLKVGYYIRIRHKVCIKVKCTSMALVFMHYK